MGPPQAELIQRHFSNRAAMTELLALISPLGVTVIVSILTCIFGAVVGVFRDDIRELVRRSNKRSPLLGDWVATYSGSSEVSRPQFSAIPVDQTFNQARTLIHVTSVKGQKVSAHEGEGCERRTFKGDALLPTLTLSFTTGKPPHQSAGIVLFVQRGHSELAGRWVEQSPDGRFHWGEVTWAKARRTEHASGSLGTRAVETSPAGPGGAQQPKELN